MPEMPEIKSELFPDLDLPSTDLIGIRSAIFVVVVAFWTI
jgi:hypothetical protein